MFHAHTHCVSMQSPPMVGAGPPLADGLDLGKAKAEVQASGFLADATQQQLRQKSESATSVAQGLAIGGIDKISGQGDGLGMGVKDTGSSLATLARALADDGVRTDFHDNREDEKIPLKSRVKGAKVSHALHRSAGQHGPEPCNHSV